MSRVFNGVIAASLMMWGGLVTTSAMAGELYGLIGKINTIPGQRDAFIELLLQGVNDMPGCLNYVVAKDAVDPNAIWVTEVWDSKASHDASLSLPAVREAISKGRALIASMGDGAATIPVGGFGLPAAAR